MVVRNPLPVLSEVALAEAAASRAAAEAAAAEIAAAKAEEFAGGGPNVTESARACGYYSRYCDSNLNMLAVPF